jgi:preprotein translocase subunit SecB
MAEQEKNQRQILLQKIYVKDFSYESPNTPEVFTKGDWSPTTNLNLRSAHNPSHSDVHEVVLTVTVDAKHEDKTLFLVEIQQAGLFQISGYSKDEFEAIVGTFCPNTLFPYAREAVANVIARGGFPEFLLQPINFDALYAESRKQAQAQAGGESGAGNGSVEGAAEVAGAKGAGGDGGTETSH